MCVTKRPWLWKGVPARGGNEPPLTDKRERGCAKFLPDLPKKTCLPKVYFQNKKFQTHIFKKNEAPMNTFGVSFIKKDTQILSQFYVVTAVQ